MSIFISVIELHIENRRRLLYQQKATFFCVILGAIQGGGGGEGSSIWNGYRCKAETSEPRSIRWERRDGSFESGSEENF